VSKLRTAQLFGVFCREQLRHRPVRPADHPPRADELRPHVLPIKRQKSGHAIHHDRPGLGITRPHQDNAQSVRPGRILVASDQLAHPFRADPCLARSAPAHDQPCGPCPVWLQPVRRNLWQASPGFPVTKSEFKLPAFQRLQHRLALTGALAGHQCVEQCFHAWRRRRHWKFLPHHPPVPKSF